MAIKRINREELNNKVAAGKVVSAVEPVVEAPVLEEVEEVVETPEEIVEEEIVETAPIKPTPVTTKPTPAPIKPTPATKPVSVNQPKTNTNKGDVKMTNTTATTKGKKTLGKKTAPKTELVERTIGTVYPKDLLLKNIQSSLDEEFEGITLADTKKIFEVVEANILAACQVASVRFLNGVVKAQHRNPLVAKAPKVDYASYTAAREVITITGAEIGQPEKYRGYVNGNVFEVTETLNYETGKYEPATGTIEIEK